jgi:carboxyl-terminal processing protease
MYKKILPAIIIAMSTAILISFSYADKPETLKPDASQSEVSRQIANLIMFYHYKKVPINDSLSSVIFDNYMKNLDGNRTYLLASDIKDFERFRFSLDDDIRSGNLDPVFYMYNIFQERFEGRIRYVIDHADMKPDFKQNERFQYNREKENWIASPAEMDQFWNKRIKYELLNLKLAGSDSTKSVETLKKRYENILSQSNKSNSYDVFQQFMSAFTESIDPHTNYFNPNNAANFNVDMARSLEGIGATLRMDNDFVTVNSIVPGGPADKSKQISIDDKFVAVAQGKDGEYTDIVGWRLDNAIQLIRGAKGTVVRLKVIPKGQDISAAPKVVELVREKIVLQDQSAKRSIRTVKSGAKTYKIGIVEIPAFYVDFKAYQSGDPNYKSTTRDVRLLLDTLKAEKVDAVIVDLRSNGGGSLMEAIDLTGLFIKSGPVVQVRNTSNQVDVGEDDDPSISWEGPMAVMVDRFSASASEIFAGAIQDYGRGIIIGTQTYGKGTVQNSIDLDKVMGKEKASSKNAQIVGKTNDSGQINLTIAKFYRINGSSTQHKGVTPDIQFPMIYPADKYGESSEPAALPWDVIASANYKKLNDLSAIDKQLQAQHEKRMKASKEYAYLLDDIKEFRAKDSEKSVSLNEDQLKKEREDKEAKDLQRENERRAARGLEPLKKGDPKPKGEKPFDFMLDESCEILADYLKLSK